jgi:hypothetical protein
VENKSRKDYFPKERFDFKIKSKDYCAEFSGHNKKVNSLSFHPTAENVLGFSFHSLNYTSLHGK